MPPNAEVTGLRHRFDGKDKNGPNVLEFSSVQNDVDDATVSTRTDLIKNIKGSEVVIDGMIYDLDGFNHPGGDSIKLFGGNDVTVQYKMIHPYHTPKHLQKMKLVGKVSDSKLDYVFDTDFEREIKREVFKRKRIWYLWIFVQSRNLYLDYGNPSILLVYFSWTNMDTCYCIRNVSSIYWVECTTRCKPWRSV